VAQVRRARAQGPGCRLEKGLQRAWPSEVDAAPGLKSLGDEDARTKNVVALASKYGRYGYRRVTALLHREDWSVNHERVELIWRHEGLKVPQRQPKRLRLWLSDGSCLRLRPLYQKHVWSRDFVATRTHDGSKLRIWTMIDEYTRGCLTMCGQKTAAR